MYVLHGSSSHCHDAPGDQNAADPHARAEAVKQEIAGHFKDEIAPKEDSSEQSELGAGDTQCGIHCQRRKTDIDPVDVGDNIQKHEQGNDPPPEFTDGSCFDITGCDSGLELSLPGALERDLAAPAEAQPEAVREIAWRAQLQLARRYHDGQ